MINVSNASSQMIREGIRPVNIRTDLGAIADLLELCFTDMDRQGQSAIREMRMFAKSGFLLTLMKSVDRMLKGLMQGFVWVENQEVVGNVSIYPAGYAQTWVIANVAVHPDFRRRGIARQLCQKALERITNWHGKAAILQVNADDPVPQQLYRSLGFYDERAFTRWRWRKNHTSRNTDPMLDVKYRKYQDRQAAYELAHMLRPNDKGGLGWLRPTCESIFRPGLAQLVEKMLNPGNREQWVIRNADRGLDALILTETTFGANYIRFDLMVHPQKQGQLEDDVLHFFMRHAVSRYRGLLTEHPSDDDFATRAFEENEFTAERRQIHMRHPL